MEAGLGLKPAPDGRIITGIQSCQLPPLKQDTKMSDDLYTDAHLLSGQRTEKDTGIIIQKYSELTEADRTEDTVWSENGVDYDDEQAVLKSLSFTEKEPILVIYKAEKVPYYHSELIDGRHIIENISKKVWCRVGWDNSENYLVDLTEGQVKEFENLIVGWLNNNAQQPTFYAVKNVTPIQITKEDIK